MKYVNSKKEDTITADAILTRESVKETYKKPQPKGVFYVIVSTRERIVKRGISKNEG